MAVRLLETFEPDKCGVDDHLRSFLENPEHVSTVCVWCLVWPTFFFHLVWLILCRNDNSNINKT